MTARQPLTQDIAPAQEMDPTQGFPPHRQAAVAPGIFAETELRASLPDLDAGWRFYRLLGLEPIVDARPHYLRFRRPHGGILGLDQGRSGEPVTLDLDCLDLDRLIRALRDADIAMSGQTAADTGGRTVEIRDPGGNRVVLHEAAVETQRAA